MGIQVEKKKISKAKSDHLQSLVIKYNLKRKIIVFISYAVYSVVFTVTVICIYLFICYVLNIVLFLCW